jgi:hypothetical protein
MGASLTHQVLEDAMTLLRGFDCATRLPVNYPVTTCRPARP